MLSTPPQANPLDPGWATFTGIRDTLQNSGQTIDYDTLLATHQAMSQARHQIPHMDQLLLSLINKRNSNPRVDQMILIYAAHALGSSKFPVPGARGIFETILAKDNRLSTWVLSFVAEAIGDYIEDIPSGNRLVDQLEAKLAQVISSSNTEEDFGQHFLPPPKGPFLPAYLSNINPTAIRESERRYYYALISNGYKEADIEKALRRLQPNGMVVKGQRHLRLLKRLAQNPDLLAQ